MASSLVRAPADLTGITQRRGAFDAAFVAQYIDGRIRVPEHGPNDMPVWGRAFDDRNQAMFDDELGLAPGIILQLVEHLRSLQRVEEPPL